MKIYVATLYCGENEWEACCESIRSQSYTNVEHHVFKYLKNLDAHEKLFENFEKSDADLLIKVDADMVLRGRDLFERIVSLFKTNSDLDLLEIEVFDHYTREQIPALNVVRRSSQYRRFTDPIFTDWGDVEKKHRMYDATMLAPAADHSPNPSVMQVFRYGVHKGLKVIQKGKLVKLADSARSHLINVEKIHARWLEEGDANYLYAWWGAEMAISGVFSIEDYDFNSPRLDQEYQSLISKSPEDIQQQANSLRDCRINTCGGNEIVHIWNLYEPVAGKNWVFFGASNMGKHAVQSLSGRMIPHVFIDNDSAKWGTTFCGIEVESPAWLTEHGFEKILVTSEYFNEIWNQLVHKLGINPDLIERYYG